MTDPRFLGTLSLSDSNTTGSMVVDHDFGFVDSKGVIWSAKKGDITNGASIPTIFKALIGGSFQEPFLPASVLHDIYCDNKTRSWRDTDNMFFEAMIVKGVNVVKARLMWGAVWTFGPHWSVAKG